MTDETASIGSELKAAREAQDLTIEQAAARLRLMNRQIAAMEEDDFEALGQPVFARGFLRNYARMLGLDADALVARLGKTGEPLNLKAENLPLVPRRSLLTSPWFLGAVAVLVVLIAIPVGLYVWLNSGEELQDEHVSPARPVAAAHVPPVMPVAPIAVKPGEEPPAPPENAITVTPILPPPLRSTPTAGQVRPEPPPVAQSTIKLDFLEDARVQITEDKSGKVLIQRQALAGTSATVTGTPPFSLEIGNAAHVYMSYNGRPLDLMPYVDDDKVARFNLEQ